MSTVSLSAIAFDAGTQIRASINEQVVSEYAERMNEGAVFPPVIVFHDGNQHYLADGFHRALAAQRNGLSEIPAELKPGTKTDALWFALGANRENGHRLTSEDKSHAVELALRQWPEKMQREIAMQVGCSESLVSKVFLRNTSVEPEIRGRALRDQKRRDEVRNLVNQGVGSVAIAKELKVTPSVVAEVRREMGVSMLDRSKPAVAQRRQDIREMAERGYTTRQIATSVGLDEETVAKIAKREGIDIRADRAVGKTVRHDSNRIVSQMVMDAENLTADVNLIEFKDLEAGQLGPWIESLTASRQALSAFIRRLTEEQKKHGEAA